MNLQSLLKSWGIPNNENEDIFAYVEEVDPGKTWLIDRFERVIDDPEVYFDGLDMHFGLVRDGSISFDDHLNEENKFIHVLRALWGKSAALVAFEVRPFATALLTENEISVITRMNVERASDDLCISFADVSDFECVARLILREMADALIVLPDKQVLLRLDAMVLLAYIRVEAILGEIQTIVRDAGLFMRRIESDYY